MNTIIQSRNTDIATKQYLNSSNSVLHKVQSPRYNTTKRQVTNLKPAARGMSHNAIHRNTTQFNSPFHRHTHTQRPMACGHLCDRQPWSDTQRDGAGNATPNPSAHPGTKWSQPQPPQASALLSPKHSAACQEKRPPVFPAGGCVQTITSNMASRLSLLARE